MAGNGVTTRLQPAPSQDTPLLAVTETPSTAPSSPTVAPDSIEERIKRQRLEQLERQNREAERAEAERAGRLVDSAIARQATGREIARLIASVEGFVADAATRISADYKLPQRDVVHALRQVLRKWRAETASAIRSQADALPMTVELELDSDDDEERQPEAA